MQVLTSIQDKHIVELTSHEYQLLVNALQQKKAKKRNRTKETIAQLRAQIIKNHNRKF